MRIALLLLFSFLFYHMGFSQAFTITDLSSLSDLLSFEKNKSSTFDPYSDFDGTPYLNDDFVPGEVIVNDSIRIEDVPLRYNIYSDRIEFRNEHEQVLEIDHSKQEFDFDFGGHLFTIQDYLDHGESKRGILELMVDGHIRLYKRYLIDLKPATKAIGYQEAQPNRFTRQDDEYLVAEGQGIPEIFRKQKDLLEKLKEIKPDIDQYAKNQKLKLKTDKGLIQLIQHCNN
ncbi:hypothetical protein [Gaoshiqia sediminis]|uniref:Secreted protein n=1 Tax=Gaoshiqia sediminis TaxID=2986998 RepID=A0AA42CAB9_9BACT|nr:hypothetical protein [Gaoshiqia sediminis]MCW0483290.1 hypothetical protein [Gaoshiqia sediminis]